MSERKNIDRLFQERFKDFEVDPPHQAWNEIEQRLKEKKKDRKVLPIWFKMAGVAAALVIGLLISDGYGDSIPNNNEVVVTDSQDSLSKTPPQMERLPENDVAITPEADSDILDSGQNQSSSDQKANQDPIDRRGSNKNRTNKSLYNRTDALVTEDLSSETKYIQNKTQTTTSNTKFQNERVATTDNKKSATDENRQPIVSNNYQKDKQENAAKNNDQNTANPDHTKQLADNASAEIKKDTAAIATVVPNALEELLKEKEDKLVTTEEPKQNRWQVSSNVAPVYFSSTSNGSPIDERFAQNKKDFENNIAYGIGVRYSISKKLTVRTGINTMGMEYNTNDVVFSQSSTSARLSNVNTNVQGSMMNIQSKNSNGIEEIALNDVPVKQFEATLNQKTGYIEIPVELSYRILNKKIGLDVIGGMSTLILNENSVSILSSGAEMEIGKANNLNDTHFSTNIGLGLKYSFLKSFEFNFEPMFKYQVNTFTNAGNFKPYFFGLYTGVNYRF